MNTDFAGRKVSYRDMWDLQAKLRSLLVTLEKERAVHEEEIVRVRKQEKTVRAFLGQQSARNPRLDEAVHAT